VLLSAAARLASLLEILETRLSASATSRDDLLSRLLIASATLLFARVQSCSRDSITRLKSTASIMRCISLVACLAASATGFLPQRVRKTFKTDKTATAQLASVDSHAAQPAPPNVVPQASADGILERASRSLGLCVLMQFFSRAAASL